MKAKALYTILSAKYKNGQVLFVDDLNFKEPKAKEGKLVLTSFAKISGFSDILSKKKNSAYVALSAKNLATERTFSNFSNLFVDEIRNMNPLDLLKYKYIVIANPEAGLPQISDKLAK
jgi:ribosomal protein L4